MSSPLWSTEQQADPGQTRALPAVTELAIIGGGILGLTTALHAARAGRSVTVFDASPPGMGASGANGGQVIPGLKHDAGALVARLGPARGRRLAEFGAGTADAVFDLIRDERMAVPHSRAGWILAAHTEAASEKLQARARACAAVGDPVEELDATSIGHYTGARGYHGGLLDRRAGAIQPFAYVSELSRVAAESGVNLRTSCRVLSVEPRGRRWRLVSEAGSMVADTVLVATNADADSLIPGLARTLLPLHSFQIATDPLSPSIAKEILPGGQTVSDTRRIVTYYRKSPDGRFVLGGRGTLGRPREVEDWSHLQNAMTRLYPQLAGYPITHRWFGRVAITLDYLPHLHEPAPGLIAVLGCQGRGVGLMTALGRPLAAYLASRDPDDLPLPVTPIRPIPFHRFRHLGVTAALAWYRMLDTLQR